MPPRLALDVSVLADKYLVEKLSLADIGRQFGVSGNTVRGRLLVAGVQFDRGERIRQKMKGRPSPRRGAKFTPEQSAAMSLSKMGNRNCAGRVISQETKEKLAAAMTGKTRYAPGVAAEIKAQRQKAKCVLNSVLRAAKVKKQARSADLLGYSRERLVGHIAGQFRPGMSWAVRGSFSIDHRIPVAEFIRRGITDPKIISSLANLQPLTPKENRQKSDKYTGDFDMDLRLILEFNASLTRRG